MDTMTRIDERIGDLLLQARGLEAVRELLARRGASREELDAHADALRRVTQQIATRLDY